MKTLLLLIITLTIHYFAIAQTIPTYCLSFGSSNGDRNQCGTATYNGNYVVAGVTNLFTNMNNFIAKCNGEGNVLWSHEVGSDFGDDFFGIMETSDHFIVVVGVVNGAMCMIKYDENGIEIWNKKIVIQTFDELVDITETSDGNYLLTGDTNDFLSGFHYCAVIKVTPAGDLIWNKNFYDFYHAEQGYSCIETADHRYVVSGYSSLFNNQIFLISMEENGDVQWIKKSVEYGVAYDLIATADSGVVAAGYICSLSGVCNPMLSKLDADGDLQWSYTYGDSLFGRFYGITALVIGGFAMAGDATDQFLNYHGFVVKCNSNGQMQWGKITDDVEFRSIGATPDGGIVVSSTTKPSVYQIYGLMKMDANGNSCPDCPTSDYGVQSAGATFTDWTLSEFSATAVITDATLAEPTLTPFVTVYCSEVGIEESEKENFSLIIFPNPVTDNFQIIIPSDFQAEKISITDVNGKIIYSNSLSPEAKLSFNASSFSNGIYSVQLFAENKISSAILAVIR